MKIYIWYVVVFNIFRFFGEWCYIKRDKRFVKRGLKKYGSKVLESEC